MGKEEKIKWIEKIRHERGKSFIKKNLEKNRRLPDIAAVEFDF